MKAARGFVMAFSCDCISERFTAYFPKVLITPHHVAARCRHTRSCACLLAGVAVFMRTLSGATVSRVNSKKI